MSGYGVVDDGHVCLSVIRCKSLRVASVRFGGSAVVAGGLCLS